MHASYPLTRPQVVKWIAALRSGKYRQGQGYLCRSGHYCCLGVLAVEVLGMKETSRRSYNDVALFDGFYVSLPTSMFPGDIQATLVRMNDLHHKTFETIACYLEDELDRFPET